jgi:hypothetical protein
MAENRPQAITQDTMILCKNDPRHFTHSVAPLVGRL